MAPETPDEGVQPHAGGEGRGEPAEEPPLAGRERSGQHHDGQSPTLIRTQRHTPMAFTVRPRFLPFSGARAHLRRLASPRAAGAASASSVDSPCRNLAQRMGTSQRTKTAVMLSRPPELLAASTSCPAASVRSLYLSRIDAICSLVSMFESPSEQSR